MTLDINHDEMARALRELESHHQSTLKPMADLVDRLYQDETDDQSKWDIIAGGANRAKYLKVGGVAVLTSAVLAACGSSKSTPAASEDTSTTVPAGASTAKADAGDLSVAKFAASVELLAVAAYKTGAPLLKDKTAIAAANAFLAQHTDHAALFNSVLTGNGAPAVTEPNAAYLAALKPAIDKLKTEMDVLLFAQDLEASAAATYFATVNGDTATGIPAFKDPKLANATISVGGTEYRHAAILSFVTKTPIASTAKGFLTKGKALKPM